MAQHKNDELIELDEDFNNDLNSNVETTEFDDEQLYKKLASNRKQNKIKKMRRVKQDLYDYFEQKSLQEKDFYYD